MHFGKGEVFLFDAKSLAPAGHYSRGLHSPASGRTFRPATPGLFSFNSPLGACPRCRGFGRIIDIDYRLVAFVRPGLVPALVLSELNANVLDAFNEFGVQIMTPAYEGQPDENVLVARGRWFDAPAKQPAPVVERSRELHDRFQKLQERGPGSHSIEEAWDDGTINQRAVES